MVAVKDSQQAVAPPAAGADEAPAAAEVSRGNRRGAAWLCAGVALLAVGAFWLVHRALIDDAYITLAYARNLATRLHWGLIATEPANAATSPLNVLLLAAATALLRLSGGVHPEWGLGVVFVASAVALAWWWSRIADALRRRLRRCSGWRWCCSTRSCSPPPAWRWC